MEGTLVVSSNRGRYALNHPGGRDLTSGDALEIQLGGHWIAGHAEHCGQSYAWGYMPIPQAGYVFYAEDGSTCGLCVGMKVRLPT